MIVVDDTPRDGDKCRPPTPPTASHVAARAAMPFKPARFSRLVYISGSVFASVDKDKDIDWRPMIREIAIEGFEARVDDIETVARTARDDDLITYRTPFVD